MNEETMQFIESAFGEGAMRCFLELNQLAKVLPEEQAGVINRFIDMLTTGLAVSFKVIEDVYKQDIEEMRNLCRNASQFLNEAKITGDGVYIYPQGAYNYVQEILAVADEPPAVHSHEERAS